MNRIIPYIIIILMAMGCVDIIAQEQVGDTVLVDEGVYRIPLGNNKYEHAIGEGSVYRDTLDVLKWGTWTPEPDTVNTYIWAIKEDLIIRASKNPAGYRIERKSKYLEFLFANNSFKTVNIQNLVAIDRGFKWTIGDGSTYTITVMRGRLKEEIYAVSPRDKFNVIINTNLNNVGNKFEQFEIMDFDAYDSLGDSLPITFDITTSNDSLFGQALVDTAGATFPIVVDPTVIYGESGKDGTAVGAGAFAGARANPTAGVLSTNELQVGWDEGSNRLHRAYTKWDLSTLPAGVTVNSFTITLDGASSSITDDFLINIYPAHDTLYAQWIQSTSVYNNIVGWVPGTTNYPQDSMTTGILGSNLSLNYDNVFNSVQAGVDTLLAHQAVDDTFRVCIYMSSNDVTYVDADGNDDYVVFDASVDANKPKLTITYSTGSDGNTITRSRGRVLREATGHELVEDSDTGITGRNRGKVLNETLRKD